MKKILGLILALVAVSAGTWVVADRVESPDQVAARAEAPAPVPVVAELDRGYLHGPVFLSVSAQQASIVTVRTPAALTGVVTAVERGRADALTPGAEQLRDTGRPVFELPGAFALYRDLEPGDTGDDVTAVQAGLREAGYGTGRDRDGVYGAGTQAAVRALYRASGYVAPENPAASAPVASEEGEGDASETQAPASTPGPRVLRSEVVMIATLPAAVESLASVGTELSAEADLVTLGTGDVLLSTTLPTGSLGALAVGAAATFTGDDGEAAGAQVTAIASGETADEALVTLAPDGAVSVGTTYVLTVDNPAVEPGDSLLAPLAAVVARGGRSYVAVRDGEVFREVEVEVTGTVGTVAAIAPVGEDSGLDEGVEVRVG
ncbi:MAG: peptidoglycan-binding domain-containing protein [Cellulomonadaceae bacterium]